MQEFRYKLYIHKDIFSQKSIHDKKIYHTLKDIAIYARTNIVKPVFGNNRGWLRSPLKGFDFYLWWKTDENLSFLIRSVRHHDDHSLLNVDDLDNYQQIYNIAQLRNLFKNLIFDDEYTSLKQEYIYKKSIETFIVFGPPGSGKTTFLKNISEIIQIDSDILYISKSNFLNEKSSQYLKIISSHNIITFNVKDVFDKGFQYNIEDEKLCFFEKIKKIYQIDPKYWEMYYDIFKSYFFGTANYNEEILLQMFEYEKQYIKEEYLKKIYNICIENDFFKNQRKMQLIINEKNDDFLKKINLNLKPSLQKNVLVLIDEFQDHTSLEIDFLMKYIKYLSNSYMNTSLFVAGDEGQSINSTFFKWSNFWKKVNDDDLFKLNKQFYLRENLRSPKYITDMLRSYKDYYQSLDKEIKPSNFDYLSYTTESVKIDPIDQIFILKLDTFNLETQLLHLSTISNSFLIKPSISSESFKELLNKDFKFNKSSDLLEYIYTIDEIKGLEAETIFLICDDVFDLEDDINIIYQRFKLDKIRIALSRSHLKLYIILIEIYQNTFNRFQQHMISNVNWFKDVKKITFNEFLDISYSTENMKKDEDEITECGSVELLDQDKVNITLNDSSSLNEKDLHIKKPSHDNFQILEYIQINTLVDQSNLFLERSLSKGFLYYLDALLICYETGLVTKEMIKLSEYFLNQDINRNKYILYVRQKIKKYNEILESDILLLENILLGKLLFLNNFLNILDDLNIKISTKIRNMISCFEKEIINDNISEINDQLIHNSLLCVITKIISDVDKDVLLIFIKKYSNLFTDSNIFNVFIKNQYYLKSDTNKKRIYFEKKISSWLQPLNKSMPSKLFHLPINYKTLCSLAHINMLHIKSWYDSVLAKPKFDKQMSKLLITYLELQNIQSDSFYMGSQKSQFQDEKPIHKIMFSKNKKISRYPISLDLWNLLLKNDLEETDIKQMNNQKIKTDIFWIEAILFCNLLSHLLDFEQVYDIDFNNLLVSWNPTKKGFRLMTEAEWEYCAWAGNSSNIQILTSTRKQQLQWYVNHRNKPTAQNTFKLSMFFGFIPEWVYDHFDENIYATRNNITTDPLVDNMIIFNRIQKGELPTVPSQSLSITKRFAHSGPNLQNNLVTFRFLLDD